MDYQLILMTIIAFSATVAVFGKAVSLMLGPLKTDIEHLKAGQQKLEAMLRELLDSQRAAKGRSAE